MDKEEGGNSPLRILLEAAARTSGAGLIGYYRLPKTTARYLYRTGWMGVRIPPERIGSTLEVISFMAESLRPVVALTRSSAPMEGLFLEEEHESALALPLTVRGGGTDPKRPGEYMKGVLFLSSPAPYHFSGSLIESLAGLIKSFPTPEVPS